MSSTMGSWIDEYFYHPLRSPFRRAKQVLHDRPDAVLLAHGDWKKSLTSFIPVWKRISVHADKHITGIAPDIPGIQRSGFIPEWHLGGQIAFKCCPEEWLPDDYPCWRAFRAIQTSDWKNPVSSIFGAAWESKDRTAGAEKSFGGLHPDGIGWFHLETWVKPGGIFVSNSRGYLIAQALKEWMPIAIGWVRAWSNLTSDCLMKAQSYASSTRNAELQGYYALMSIVNKCILKKEVPARHFSTYRYRCAWKCFTLPGLNALVILSNQSTVLRLGSASWIRLIASRTGGADAIPSDLNHLFQSYSVKLRTLVPF